MFNFFSISGNSKCRHLTSSRRSGSLPHTDSGSLVPANYIQYRRNRASKTESMFPPGIKMCFRWKPITSSQPRLVSVTHGIITLFKCIFCYHLVQICSSFLVTLNYILSLLAQEFYWVNKPILGSLCEWIQLVYFFILWWWGVVVLCHLPEIRCCTVGCL